LFSLITQPHKICGLTILIIWTLGRWIRSQCYSSTSGFRNYPKKTKWRTRFYKNVSHSVESRYPGGLGVSDHEYEFNFSNLICL